MFQFLKYLIKYTIEAWGGTQPIYKNKESSNTNAVNII